MSGGSYGYLFFATSADELANRREDLERMADRLAELPWARGAAAETLRFASMLRRIDAQLAASKDLLDVWHAIEWWDSGDYGEDQTRSIVEKYENLTAHEREAVSTHSERTA